MVEFLLGHAVSELLCDPLANSTCVQGHTVLRFFSGKKMSTKHIIANLPHTDGCSIILTFLHLLPRSYHPQAHKPLDPLFEAERKAQGCREQTCKSTSTVRTMINLAPGLGSKFLELWNKCNRRNLKVSTRAFEMPISQKATRSPRNKISLRCVKSTE